MTDNSSNVPIIRVKIFRPPVASDFISCSPLLLFVLLMLLLLGTPLSVWAEPAHLPLTTHVEEGNNGTGRGTSRTLVFLGNNNLPPFTYMQDGKLIGIIVDLGEALIKQMNQPVRLDYMVWAKAQQHVLEGKADALLLINSTEERKKRFDFSDALLESEFSIYIKHTSTDIYRPDGLKGLKVGVQNKGLVFNLLQQDPLINLVTFVNILDGFRSLQKGKLDAVVMDSHTASFLLAENKIGGIRITGEPVERSSSRIAVRKGNTALLAEINSALAAIKEDGTYASIMSKWQSQEVVFQTKEQAQRQEMFLFAVYVIGGIAIALTLLFIFLNKRLKRKVNERTSELTAHKRSLELEIIERKKVEHDLRASSDYLKNLTDSMGDAVFSIKMPEREIEWLNDSYNMFGYDPEECLGRSTEFLYASRQEFLALGEMMVEALQNGKDIFHSESEFRRKNGEIFPAESTNTVFKVNNEVVSVTGILRDVSVRRMAEEKVLAYQKRLKALASQLTLVEETERRRIATDLHDDVCQSLALLRIQVSSARKKATSPSLTAKLDDIAESLLQTLQSTRRLMSDLSSPSMNEIGLPAAISELLVEFVEKQHNLKTEFIDNTDDLALNVLENNVRAILFRNVRELITNVIKHARAKKVSVCIQKIENLVMLTIQDDGIGFDPDAKSNNNGQNGGFGLFSIKERMSDLNGTFEMVSAPGDGCKVLLTVPIVTDDIKS